MEISSPAVKTNKRNRKPSIKTNEMYKSAIEACTGTVTDLSRRLDITHGSVSIYLDKYPEMRELLAKKRMSNVELAEDVLFRHLDCEDPKISQDSAKYIAGRLGKNRGWTEKTETEISGTMNSTIDLSLITMCDAYNESNSKSTKGDKSSDKE